MLVCEVKKMGDILRADVALYQSGLAPSRTAAQKAIEEGRAFADDRRIERPSEKLPINAKLRVVPREEEYVSRGAYKLIGAIEAFHIDVNGLVCADIGASTGGFTQVLLRHGAKKVYAIDVGENQLADELRKDDRVVCMEHTNARTLQAGSLPEKIDLIVYDVSFISATLLYDAMLAISSDNVRIIGLIKPQFEAGRQAIGKNGIVKKAADQENAIYRCCDAAKQRGLCMTGLIVSPIHGGDGNTEYLCLFEKDGGCVSDTQIKACVKTANTNK